MLANGDPFHIIHPGYYNTHQGPDFSEARIKINDTLWVGNVELHIQSSDWNKHRHQTDKNYNNVILHVVWEHDMDTGSTNLPVFILHDRVSKLLLQQYFEWMNGASFIPCEKNIHRTNDMVWFNWKERLLVERLQRKTALVQNHLQQNNQHWEETFWRMLAKNFGIKVNADAFEAIAQSLPINVLARHKNQIHQLEALLLGQGGLLEKEFEEDYPRMLQKEYRFLQKKHSLKPIHLPVYFLRMRPINFPTIRLAQLAMLVHHSNHLFSKIKETVGLKEIKTLLNVTANDFWHYHYTLDEQSDYKPKNLGEQMIENIIINTIIPVLFAYGLLHKENQYKQKALKWMEELGAEKNSITSKFKGLSIGNSNAFESQALIELKTQYCDNKRCLDCAVGNALLKTTN